MLPSPKLAKLSPPPASEPGAEESLPPELLLVASAEASFENDEGPLPWPPPQPERAAAYASKPPATSKTARFMKPSVASRRTPSPH